MQKISYLFLAAILLLQACSLNGDNTYENNVKSNEQIIQQYITNKNLQVQASTSGLRYKVTNYNSAAKAPSTGSQIVMAYVGKLTNGTVFDTARNKPDEFLRFPYRGNYVIPGIEEVVGYMKTGDSAIAIVPFYLGFGSNAAYNGVVPSYSVLVFDLKLVAVQTEDEALQDYISRKKFPEDSVVKTQTGLYAYFKKKNPSGTAVSGKSQATVTYKGTFLDGQIFDQTPTGQTSNFYLTNSGLIAGFTEALKLMKVGETAVFMMPSSLGYKESGTTGIPPYSPLVFELSVVSAQ
ncbi:FKBP-type peptidyl-prolyl cis-trans isomerase [Cytophagaceae bacterium DM2B3-1]|uniref:Peptidyl-prolyl cis-trans isomerase n=1 Tax=Xanthocytophaga flava TaxID=3048013 RepID=A0ABT7CPS7_9BACT|nr:FKBP-type peptidyl-prolyl cis-trans isomerase [Xanthocytophaga flavus]MDJ1471248.1 FKBP-type peptidyl-prolyl cis-trans isomerase [Xanthocytophaga flavus]MDJ1495753.1 FKBP-type peptidyl-prolyl cis-trans isomerase [Xanthocytophaga flavus]